MLWSLYNLKNVPNSYGTWSTLSYIVEPRFVMVGTIPQCRVVSIVGLTLFLILMSSIPSLHSPRITFKTRGKKVYLGHNGVLGTTVGESSEGPTETRTNSTCPDGKKQGRGKNKMYHGWRDIEYQNTLFKVHRILCLSIFSRHWWVELSLT